MEQSFFSFFEIPDLICRNKYTREQYEKLKKFILKVKSLYIKMKQEKKQADKEKENTDKSIYDDDVSQRKSQSANDAEKTANEVITDEDLVPFVLLDQVLERFKYKQSDLESTWLRFVKSCNDEKTEKMGRYKSEGDKKKKLIDQALFAEILNTKLEKLHMDITADTFKHSLLHYNIVDQYHLFTGPKEYCDTYKKVMGASDPKSKYYAELQEQIESELAKFNGKVGVGNEAETISSMSGLTKKSAIKGQGNIIAAKALGEHSESPPKVRTDKGVAFDDGDQSPRFDRGDLKDNLADDPKRRTDGIDKILGGDTEGLDVDGGSASLHDLSKQANTRQMK